MYKRQNLIRAVVLVVVVLGIASVLVVSVVQKQREIGILRAMGATRAQVLRVFLVQGAVVGALGSVLGVLLAWVMVELFTRFVRGSDGLPLFDISLPPALAPVSYTHLDVYKRQGLITDYPDRLREVMLARGLSLPAGVGK